MATTEERLVREPVDLVNAIAGFGLPGTDDRPVNVGGETWSETLAHIKGQRLSGLATAAWEGGWLRLSEEQAGQLLQIHQAAMIQVITLEQELLRLGEALDGSGVEFVVLKGPAFAHSVYPDPSWRAFGDLDLLVHTRDWKRVLGIFEELGLRRELPEPRPGFDERFGKAAAHRAGSGLEIDLHRTLVVGPYGLWIDSESMFGQTVEFRLGGRTFRRFGDTRLLLHGCVHAVLGLSPPLLTPLRDVGQTATAGDVDWDDLQKQIERWKLSAVTNYAFRTASTVLGVSWPQESGRVRSLRPMRSEIRILEAYTTTKRGRGGTALATIKAIPGVRQKSAYLLALLVPGRQFLESRQEANGGSPSYLRRWAVPVRWLRGRSPRIGSGGTE